MTNNSPIHWLNSHWQASIHFNWPIVGQYDDIFVGTTNNFSKNIICIFLFGMGHKFFIYFCFSKVIKGLLIYIYHTKKLSRLYLKWDFCIFWTSIMISIEIANYNSSQDDEVFKRFLLLSPLYFFWLVMGFFHCKFFFAK